MASAKISEPKKSTFLIRTQLVGLLCSATLVEDISSLRATSKAAPMAKNENTVNTKRVAAYERCCRREERRARERKIERSVYLLPRLPSALNGRKKQEDVSGGVEVAG